MCNIKDHNWKLAYFKSQYNRSFVSVISRKCLQIGNAPQLTLQHPHIFMSEMGQGVLGYNRVTAKIHYSLSREFQLVVGIDNSMPRQQVEPQQVDPKPCRNFFNLCKQGNICHMFPFLHRKWLLFIFMYLMYSVCIKETK